MSNKNPFELRTDLLAMAKDYLDKQYEINTMFAEKAAETLNKQSADYQEQIKEVMPKPYTMGELIDKANELYSFVTKK
mgnify:CR=1 FL=1